MRWKEGLEGYDYQQGVRRMGLKGAGSIIWMLDIRGILIYVHGRRGFNEYPRLREEAFGDDLVASWLDWS